VPERPSTPRPLRRRKVLSWFLGTTVGAFLASAVYPVTRFLIPPKTGESTAGGVTLDLKEAAIRPNTGQIFKFGNQPGILIRTPAGELRAFTAVCTHLQCTVQYRPDSSHIWCACHNGHYDLQGKNIAGPPPRPLERYALNVRDDKIVVRRTAPS